MAGRLGWFRLAAVCAAFALVLAVPLVSGCGDGSAPQDGMTAVTDTATAFFNALGDQDFEVLRSLMTQDYIYTNGVPDPITRERFVTALGNVNSYRFVPEEDVAVEGDRAVVTVDIDVAGQGPSEETLVLSLENGEWKVDAFTAMDWSEPTTVQDKEKVEVEQALRDFLIACIDGDTAYIFDNLSKEYKENHRLQEPWTPKEFSGVFGIARSFDFNADEIEVEDGAAEVDVTVEFGSRGNLESETSRVGLVFEGNTWLIDTFPFFIY